MFPMPLEIPLTKGVYDVCRQMDILTYAHIHIFSTENSSRILEQERLPPAQFLSFVDEEIIHLGPCDKYVSLH